MGGIYDLSQEYITMSILYTEFSITHKRFIPQATPFHATSPPLLPPSFLRM